MSPLLIAAACVILMGHSTPSAHVTPDAARPYIGTWTAVLEGPAGPVSLQIAVSVDEGGVVASVSSDLMSDGRTQEITKLDEGIAFHYTAELWGYAAPVEVALVRVQDELAVDCWVMRQFLMRGLASRVRRDTP